MDEYISRGDVLDIAMQYCPDDDGSCSKADADPREMLDEIEALPTADVQPVKHSHWFYPFSELDINRCWECGMHVQDKINNVRETFKYCPHCGARMDGGAG